MATTSTTEVTTNHDEIKDWARERGGEPAVADNTEKDPQGKGVIRIKFDEDNDLKTVDWDHFFQAFDNNDLAMIYQDKTEEGKQSRFHKFVEKDSPEVKEMKG